MRLLQLRYFLAAAKYGSITKAAEHLYVSQPTVSQAIARLEEEIGARLFDRSGRNIKLNPYGEILLKYTENILYMIDQATKEIKNTKQTINNKLIIGGWAGSLTLIRLITEFTKKYPYIDATYVQSNQLQDCDVKLFYSTINTPPDNCSVLLLQEELLLAVPNDNPLSRHDTLSLSSIRDENMIGPHAGKPLSICASIYCSAAGFEPKIILEYDVFQTLQQMLRLNYGIAFLPEKSWGDVSEPQSYKLVRLEFPRCSRSLYASWDQNKGISDVVQLFIDFIKEYFSVS